MENDELPSELVALRAGLDSPGPALPLSPERERALLDAALAEQSPLVVVRSRRSGRLAAVWALVAVSAVAAVAGLLLVNSRPPPSTLAPPHVVVPVASVPSVAAPSAPPSGAAGPSAATQPLAPASSVAPRPVAAPSSSTEAVREVDLLKQANDLRRSGDFAGAEKLYRQVIQRYPQTASAYVAMSSVASLVMGRDPAAAAEMYRAARRAQPTGSLDLEIRQGLARAYRKQGQAAAEQRELSELVTRYPDTEAAGRARTRLAELGAAR